MEPTRARECRGQVRQAHRRVMPGPALSHSPFGDELRIGVVAGGADPHAGAGLGGMYAGCASIEVRGCTPAPRWPHLEGVPVTWDRCRPFRARPRRLERRRGAGRPAGVADRLVESDRREARRRRTHGVRQARPQKAETVAVAEPVPWRSAGSGPAASGQGRRARRARPAQTGAARGRQSGGIATPALLRLRPARPATGA